jgi:hypothetical protein
MIALKRKTLLLCRTCHDDIHAGRAMTRQQIKLTEVKALQKKAKTLLLESRMRPKVHVRFAGGGSEKGYRDTTRKFKEAPGRSEKQSTSLASYPTKIHLWLST